MDPPAFTANLLKSCFINIYVWC